MPYNAKNDKTLKTVKNKGGLFFAEIKSYQEGPAKVQLRRNYLTKDGELKNCTVGRLSVSDLEFLHKKHKKIVRLLKETNGETLEEREVEEKEGTE